jgi:hypothetical protein
VRQFIPKAESEVMTETTANSEYASKEMEIGQEAKDSPISDPENAAVKDTDEIDAMATPAFMITNKCSASPTSWNSGLVLKLVESNV